MGTNSSIGAVEQSDLKKKAEASVQQQSLADHLGRLALNRTTRRVMRDVRSNKSMKLAARGVAFCLDSNTLYPSCHSWQDVRTAWISAEEEDQSQREALASIQSATHEGYMRGMEYRATVSLKQERRRRVKSICREVVQTGKLQVGPDGIAHIASQLSKPDVQHALRVGRLDVTAAMNVYNPPRTLAIIPIVDPAVSAVLSCPRHSGGDGRMHATNGKQDHADDGHRKPNHLASQIRQRQAALLSTARFSSMN